MCVAAVVLLAVTAAARNPIRRTFFDLYPEAAGTQLDDVPSNAGHCGVCHFDFDGGGPRNPYGLAVEVGLNNGLSNTDAIMAVDGDDADADGFTNSVEASDVIHFGNTPTFPGLTAGNYTSAINVTLSDIAPYLTPSGGSDTTAPSVEVLSPNGGETVTAESFFSISYSASDESGISKVNIYLSDDGGLSYKQVARNVTPGSGYSWFVPNRPGASNRILVEAVDGAGNSGDDGSDADFTIQGTPAGYVPTTLRDMDMSGTQPHEGAILDDPDASCGTCHGNYNASVEPWHNWRGSMMGQAARDPFFFACVAVAEQDAPSVGDLCIRCHSPGGWQEGRSVDTGAGLLTVKDRHGVQCDFCHRAVDHNYVVGSSPTEDVAVLATVDPLPLQYGNGQFINDPAPVRRGPYADAQADHQFVESPFHRSADMCGLCHDVSSPVFNQAAPGDYVPNTFDLEHSDMQIRNMMPIERTYSEWSVSEYAEGGVYAPQFAGDKPDGVVSTCQDCHMRDVTGKGADGGPNRTDIGMHDFTGGNTFVPDIIATYYPDEVDAAQLADAKARARAMLQLAATLELTPTDSGVSVRVTNETGHKLPSGYPEGRRMWLNVVATDALGQQVFESGAYDLSTGVLAHDAQERIYEIQPGLSPALASALGLPAGKSFHFVLNDTVYSDNRIPPRGATLAELEAVQSPVVNHTYVDGQYWDIADYALPAESESVFVTLYYQSTSKEYVEFLRDENTTNSAGQDLYDAWVAQGKAPPEMMAHARTAVTVTDTDVPEPPETYVYALKQNAPNPFHKETAVLYSLASEGRVTVCVYDVAGRRVRTLVDEVLPPGEYRALWYGRDDAGAAVASGIYFIHFESGGHEFRRKAALLR
jgi:cytochrome c553